MKDEETPTKVSMKRTLDDKEEDQSVKKPKTESGVSTLKGAEDVKVLNEDVNRKVVFLQMKLPSTTSSDDIKQDAVVILERKPFNSDDMSDILNEGKLTAEMVNDLYGTYTLTLPPKYCQVRANVVFPATEKHIAKYSWEAVHIIRETEEDYETITKPMVDGQFEKQVFNLTWIYNIIEGKAEVHKVVCEKEDDDGFVVVMDYKWNGDDPKLLHCLGLPKRRDLRSIRDLRAEHVPLLEEMRQKAVEAFERKFNVKGENVKAYFHYQPSFYHLHLHFTNVEAGCHAGTDAWRAHLLDDVIDNLKMCSDYYKKKTLSFILKENDALSLEFKKARKDKQ